MVVSEYPHHVVQRGNNRQDIFFDDEDRRLYLGLLKKYSSECACKIHAYCLMNNHVHILFVPERDYSLAKTMQKLSLRFTQHINKKYKRTGRLWECRFHSSLIDKEEYLWIVCRYIERNPVRANIVSEPNLYQWSSARANTMAKQNGFIEPIWQDNIQRREYTEFLNTHDDKNEMDMIRKHTYTGKPIGKERFLNRIVEKLGIAITTRHRGRPRKK